MNYGLNIQAWFMSQGVIWSELWAEFNGSYDGRKVFLFKLEYLKSIVRQHKHTTTTGVSKLFLPYCGSQTGGP